MFKKHSISFTLLMLLIGFLLGAVMGSLLETTLGVSLLNKNLLPGEGWEVKNFYVINRLIIQITPASLLGIAVIFYFLYKQSKKI